MAQTLVVPGIKGDFVAGLAWRTHAQPPKADAIRAWSIRSGRWGLTYKTSEGRTQVGLCDPVPGIDSPGKLKSLAASVAGQQIAPWRARYQLADGRFWYIAVRDRRAIIPDGDQIGTHSDIQRIWEEHTKLGEWNELPNGTVDDIADMLSATSAANSLHDLQARPLVRFLKTYTQRIAIVVTIVGVAAVAIAHILGYGVKHRHAETLRAVAPVVHVQPPATRPWVDEPIPSQVIDVCHHAWSAKALERKGWSVVSWSCATAPDGVEIKTSWTRTYGLASDAPGVLNPTGQASTESTVVPAIFGNSPDVVNSSDLAVRTVRDFADIHGYTATFGEAADKPTLPGAVESNDSGPWTSSKVALNVPWAPWLGLASAFDGVSGLRIRSVTWNSQADQWVIDGALYGVSKSGARSHVSRSRPIIKQSESQTNKDRHENF